MEKYYLFHYQLRKTLESVLQFLPKNAKRQVNELLIVRDVDIKLSKKRTTKHGDFIKKPNGTFQITINKTSNSYRFLITLLHELAHYDVYRKYVHYVKPHGEEWKFAFKNILLPFLNTKIFPEPLCRLLANHMINPKASTDRDFHLVMALRKYDEKNFKKVVFELNSGQIFQIGNGRKFKKLAKRRKNYECEDLNSGKIYLFSPQIEVFLI